MFPDWMVRSGEGLSATDYEALPEEVSRRIEILDGGIVVCPGRPRTQKRVARRLANRLERVVPDGFTVNLDTDLRLRDAPLVIRRPEVTVYEASLPDHEALRPEHCLLVVEVMSQESVTTDRLHKPAEYAAYGVRHFWRVEYDDHGIDVFRYRLDPTKGSYALVGLDKGELSTKDPVALDLDLEGLR
jgi:Uma2 family endonuclease